MREFTATTALFAQNVAASLSITAALTRLAACRSKQMKKRFRGVGGATSGSSVAVAGDPSRRDTFMHARRPTFRDSKRWKFSPRHVSQPAPNCRVAIGAGQSLLRPHAVVS